MSATRLSVVLIGLALVVGCQTAKSSTPGAEGPNGVFKSAADHAVAAYEYRVDPPDQITVLAPAVVELNNQSRTVGLDGTVTFNLIGNVYLAGKTPDEIAKLLRELTRQYYQPDPDIKVVVTPNSKFYYVFGSGINNQGPKPFTGRVTVIQALADAGFNEGGWPEQVRISRPDKSDKTKSETAVIDFTKIWDTGDMSQNYLLEVGDIINVPDSPLTKFNKGMTAVIGPITGASAGASGTRSIVGTASGKP